MNDLGDIWATIQDQPAWLRTTLAIGGAVLGVIAAVALVAIAIKIWRGKSANFKKTLGFGVVQAGVTYAIVQGVYEFWRIRVGMPEHESAVQAVFFEAATWGAVGFIVAHGRKPGSVGFGDAAGFFWFTIAGGGALAVLGATDWKLATGRVVVVLFGAFMWYLQLRQVTRRAEGKTRWRWTPERLWVALGAKTPIAKDDQDRDDERDWMVARIARAIRWSNSRWVKGWRTPLAMFGGRSLTKLGEQTTPDVIAEARLRYAFAHVLVDQVAPDSEVMLATIEAVKAAATASLAQLTELAGHPVDLGGHPDRYELTTAVTPPGPRVPGTLTATGQPPVTGHPDRDQPALTAAPRHLRSVPTDAPVSGAGGGGTRDPYVVYADAISSVQAAIEDWKTRDRSISAQEVLDNSTVSGKPTALKVKNLIEAIADRDPAGAIAWLVEKKVVTAEDAAGIQSGSTENG